MVTCNQCRVSVRFVRGGPETVSPSPPLTPSAAAAAEDEHYSVSIAVTCLLSFHPMWTETLPPLPRVRVRKTLRVSRHEFLADAKASVCRVLSDVRVVLTGAGVETLALRALKLSRKAIARNPSIRALPLQVTITAVKFVWSPAGLERLMTELAARLSRSSARGTVPAAAKASIEALECVAVNGTRDRQDRCTICLEELNNIAVFDSDDHDHNNHDIDDDQDSDQRVVLVRMPCSHVYHKDCIVQWLKKNHKCPLCRYAMPII